MSETSENKKYYYDDLPYSVDSRNLSQLYNEISHSIIDSNGSLIIQDNINYGYRKEDIINRRVYLQDVPKKYSELANELTNKLFEGFGLKIKVKKTEFNSTITGNLLLTPKINNLMNKSSFKNSTFKTNKREQSKDYVNIKAVEYKSSAKKTIVPEDAKSQRNNTSRLNSKENVNSDRILNQESALLDNINNQVSQEPDIVNENKDENIDYHKINSEPDLNLLKNCEVKNEKTNNQKLKQLIDNFNDFLSSSLTTCVTESIKYLIREKRRLKLIKVVDFLNKKRIEKLLFKFIINKTNMASIVKEPSVNEIIKEENDNQKSLHDNIIKESKYNPQIEKSNDIKNSQQNTYEDKKSSLENIKKPEIKQSSNKILKQVSNKSNLVENQIINKDENNTVLTDNNIKEEILNKELEQNVLNDINNISKISKNFDEKKDENNQSINNSFILNTKENDQVEDLNEKNLIEDKNNRIDSIHDDISKNENSKSMKENNINRIINQEQEILVNSSSPLHTKTNEEILSNADKISNETKNKEPIINNIKDVKTNNEEKENIDKNRELLNINEMNELNKQKQDDSKVINDVNIDKIDQIENESKIISNKEELSFITNNRLDKSKTSLINDLYNNMEKEEDKVMKELNVTKNSIKNNNDNNDLYENNNFNINPKIKETSVVLNNSVHNETNEIPNQIEVDKENNIINKKGSETQRQFSTSLKLNNCNIVNKEIENNKSKPIEDINDKPTITDNLGKLSDSIKNIEIATETEIKENDKVIQKDVFIANKNETEGLVNDLCNNNDKKELNQSLCKEGEINTPAENNNEEIISCATNEFDRKVLINKSEKSFKEQNTNKVEENDKKYDSQNDKHRKNDDERNDKTNNEKNIKGDNDIDNSRNKNVNNDKEIYNVKDLNISKGIDIEGKIDTENNDNKHTNKNNHFINSNDKYENKNNDIDMVNNNKDTKKSMNNHINDIVILKDNSSIEKKNNVDMVKNIETIKDIDIDKNTDKNNDIELINAIEISSNNIDKILDINKISNIDINKENDNKSISNMYTDIKDKLIPFETQIENKEENKNYSKY